MMIYQDFALIYDKFMENVEYDKWAEFVDKNLKENDIEGYKILELACGTGNVTGLLRKMDYEMTGVDISDKMLSLAQEKSHEEGLKITYLNQDIIELDLNRKFDAVISFCDGINYIVNRDDLNKVFENVYKHLNSGGLFIFDISSEYKLKNILGNNTFAETSEDSAYIWENYYDEETRILEFDLNIFVEDEGVYIRSLESHIQKAHKVEELKKILEDKGFKIIGAYGNIDFGPIEEDSERVFICAQK